MNYNLFLRALFGLAFLGVVSGLQAMDTPNVDVINAPSNSFDNSKLSEQPEVLTEYKKQQAGLALDVLYKTIQCKVEACNNPEEFNKVTRDLKNSNEIHLHLTYCAYLADSTPEDRLTKLASLAWANKRTDIALVAYSMKNNQNALLSKESVTDLAVQGGFETILNIVTSNNDAPIDLIVTKILGNKKTKPEAQFALMELFYRTANPDKRAIDFRESVSNFAREMNGRTNNISYVTAHSVADRIFLRSGSK